MTIVSDLYIQTGWTALFTASFKGHTAVVKLLLKNGADVSIRDKVSVCTLCVYTILLL